MTTITIQRQYVNLVSGVMMCIAGLAIFVYLSPYDFLEPGFVRDGVLIQDEYVSPAASLNAVLPAYEIGKEVTVFLTNPLAGVLLRMEVKDPDGMTIYDSNSDKSMKATFRVENLGKYTVTISNIGREITKIAVSYGHTVPYEVDGKDDKSLLGISWILLIIVGSYLIMHTDLKILFKERK